MHVQPTLGSEGQLHTVALGDFTTEAGVRLPIELAYMRFGEPNADASNIILVEHALTGDADVADWWSGLVGPGLAFDTNVYCVVCSNALGGCRGSTGPSSLAPDGSPWGSRFPALSIRDLVRAEKLLIDALSIRRLHAVAGGSMGGARTLEWALLYPELVGACLVVAVSPRASAWQIGVQQIQVASIVHDPHWAGGDYYGLEKQPHQGLITARKLAHLTYRGELEIDERFGTEPQENENPLGAYRDATQRFAVESYLDYQGAKLVERFDAGSYVTLTEALNRHDVGRGRGGLIPALARITMPVMVAGVDTDILYPYYQQELIARNVASLLGMAHISSPVGHDAFLVETRQMDNIVRRFLAALSED